MARKGMKIGRKHTWKYKGVWKETKINPTTWKIRYENTKTRKGYKATKGQGLPVGSKLVWKFKNMKQYAIKISPNKYKTVLEGIKYMGAYKLPKKRWKK
jgi:hypothetical protein